MADSGTPMSSSSSKDARQQETFERSVDQDTPAQGVYLYIYMQFIYLLHYLLRSKLISTQELAYTPRHICLEISTFPAPFNVGFQDSIGT